MWVVCWWFGSESHNLNTSLSDLYKMALLTLQFTPVQSRAFFWASKQSSQRHHSPANSLPWDLWPSPPPQDPKRLELFTALYRQHCWKGHCYSAMRPKSTSWEDNTHTHNFTFPPILLQNVLPLILSPLLIKTVVLHYICVLLILLLLLIIILILLLVVVFVLVLLLLLLWILYWQIIAQLLWLQIFNL